MKQAQFDAFYNKVANPSDAQEKKVAVKSIADILKHQHKKNFDPDTGFDNSEDTAAQESAAFLNHEEAGAEKSAQALAPAEKA